jgi:hypothetical protein
VGNQLNDFQIPSPREGIERAETGLVGVSGSRVRGKLWRKSLSAL